MQERWIKEYLRQFHVRPKWNRPVTNLQIGDLVEVIESALGQHRLPIARVIKTYPGPDRLVRVVDVYDGKATMRRAIQKLTLLLPAKQADDDHAGQHRLSAREYVQV